MATEEFGFTSVAIKNFRGIASGEIKGFGKINVLLGKFGAGKSTVLESVYLSTVITGERNNLYNTFSRRSNREGHYKQALYKYGLDTVATITYKINKNALEVELGRGTIIKSDVGEFALRVMFNGTNIGTLGYNKNLGHSGGNISTTSIDNPTSSFLQRITLIDNKYKTQVQSVETQFLNPIREQNLDEEFMQVLMSVFDDVKNFEFLEHAPGSNQFRVALKFEDSKVFVDDISDGLRDGLIILANAFLLKYTAVLLEEPENHMYPKALAKMIEKLVEISMKNNLQLFITTHRPEVVANFVKFGTDAVKIFYVEKKNAIVTARPSEWNNIRILIELGLDAGLLAKGFEKYVVVDGDMDKAILESSIRKDKGVRAEDLWLTIIPARGDTNRKEIVKALIPTGKAIIIFKDMDESSRQNTTEAVIDSIRSLGNEGYNVNESDDRIELQKGDVKCLLLKQNIYAIGIENLTYDGNQLQFDKHAIDDYVLELIINNYNSLGINKIQLDAAISEGRNSKQVLERIMPYKTDEVVNLIEKISLSPSLKDLVTALTS